jgi:hypothetical protein
LPPEAHDTPARRERVITCVRCRRGRRLVETADAARVLLAANPMCLVGPSGRIRIGGARGVGVRRRPTFSLELHECREPPVAALVLSSSRHIAGMRRLCACSPARGVTVADPFRCEAGDPRRTVAQPGSSAATAAPAPQRSRIRGSAAAQKGLRGGQDPEPRPRSRRASARRQPTHARMRALHIPAWESVTSRDCHSRDSISRRRAVFTQREFASRQRSNPSGSANRATCIVRLHTRRRDRGGTGRAQ